MTAPVTLADLRRELAAAQGGESENGGATARVIRALDAIGWRGADSATPEEVAAEILPAITSCVQSTGEMGALYWQVAQVLRANGPAMDGGLPPAAAYVPAAAEIVRRFVRG